MRRGAGDPASGRWYAAPPPAAVPQEARRRRRALLLRYGVLLAATLAGALVHVWSRLQVTRIGYALSETHRLVTELEQDQRELEIEFGHLTSPRQLAALAGARLGLRWPRPGEVFGGDDGEVAQR